MRISKDQINNLPQLPGIYKFSSLDNKLLYVGKARNLKKRIASYFSPDKKDLKTQKLINQIYDIGIISVASEFEALLLEAKLIHENKPKYNVSWKDDKHYIYIKITREKFPKVLFARRIDANGDFFGPFPSSTIVREILAFLRTIFPYCTQKETAKRVCFYNHLGLCNPCPAEVSKLPKAHYKKLLTQYQSNIRNIKKILAGKNDSVKKLLISQMNFFSNQQNFEQAAIYRDRLSHLDYLVNRYTPVESYIANPRLLEKIRDKETAELTNLLKNYFPQVAQVHRIECYDVSNISGKLATGSMVTFTDGVPQKNLYRRFRIKFNPSADGPDDFAMLAEVLRRRLGHPEWFLPDLVVIDGGKPQLLAATKVFRDSRINVPVIGLAKRFEELVLPKDNSYIKIKLGTYSNALNLVKRLRDEAHRFAHNYHTLLRLKYLLSPVEN